MPRLAATLPLLFVLALAAGADEPRTITVRGKGSVKAKPDTMTVTFNATGKAEKAADATDKLKAKIATLRSDLEGILKEKGCQEAKVMDTGVAFASVSANAAQAMVWINGQANKESPGEMTASSEVVVTVPKVDAMKSEDVASLISALLDKGADAGGEGGAADPTGVQALRVFTSGMSAGGLSPVKFTISDPEKAMDKAWDEAVARARARAETIASKLHLGVGGAVRVKDLSDGDASVSKVAVAAGWMGYPGVAGGACSQGTSGEAELNVELEVEFELTKAEGDKK